ncbi:autotransporter outer membrane beta-barrel domain-containing protein [Achromobacter sp. DH1f]|uniref:autotransporter family protein n=1 Tax=Achromobacter sp. DH1f TaxID=1397275 RepID=UPI000AD3C1F0|nr:autotransporter outer membrane beta-barrel domain-containing protein [Achromobacter sp. DH1f]
MRVSPISRLAVPSIPSSVRLLTLLVIGALGVSVSIQAVAGGAGGTGISGGIEGGRGGSWDNGGIGESNDPGEGLPGFTDATANRTYLFTTHLEGGLGGSNGIGGGGAAIFLGGANANVTVSAGIIGGFAYVGYDGNGGGGDGLIVLSGKITNTGTGNIAGGDSTFTFAGSGGGGGHGVYLGSGELHNQAGGSLTGGRGAYNAGPSANGNGGNGGDGAFVQSGVVFNQGAIKGGYGGSTSTPGGKGGNGGAGLVIMNGTGGALSVDNQGFITGGEAGGYFGSPTDSYVQGNGGAGLIADTNVTIRNRGTIQAGTNAERTRLGDAVLLQGNGNRLELWNGSNTIGDVRSLGRNTLALGSADGAPVTAVIDGNVSLSAASTYETRVTAAGQSDKLTIRGNAQLGGAAVSVLAGNGTYAENTTYTILSAQSLTGRFASASSNLAYLTPTVANNGNDVVLTLARRVVPPVTPDNGSGNGNGNGNGNGEPARPMKFEDAANSRNQRSVANAVESLSTGNPVYQAVLNLPVGAPAAAFQALSGETHASAASSLRNTASTAAAVPLEHFRSNLNAVMQAGVPTAAAGGSDAAPAASTLPQSSARPIWAQVVGNWQRSSATGETAEVRQHTGGLFMGADHALANGWRVGGAVGYTDARARADAVNSQADISSYSLTLYSGKSFAAGPGKLNFLAGGAYTWHDIGTQRRVSLGAIDQKLTADYGASTAQLFTELGYALPINSAFTLEPYAGVSWSDQRIRGFSESGGSAALSGERMRNDLTTTTLGLRTYHAVALGSLDGVVRGTLGWRHAFGDVQPRTSMAFEGSDTFTAMGAPIARDAALLELSLDAQVSRSTTVALGYSGQFGNGNRDQTGSVTLRWKF